MASTSIQRTPSSAGNRRKFTLSVWCKKHSSSQMNFIGTGGSGDQNHIQFDGSDRFQIRHYAGGHTILVNTKALLRDTSAWYHLVGAVDTTQATNSNGLKVYINGSLVSGSFSSYNQNVDTSINKDSSTMAIGHREQDGANHYDGYISEVHFIDGSQKSATDFGETNDNGVWIPKAYSGSYGTNGFKLEFKNSGSLGTDTSGNGNNFTATNLTATDQTTDTPTNNFATVNPLTETQGVINFSEGNTKIEGNTSTQGSARSSIQIPPSGKWYIESEFDAIGGSGSNAFGFVTESYTSHSIDSSGGRGVKASYSGGAGSRVIQIMNGSSQIGSNINVSSGIIMQLAVDQDNGKAWLGKDDTYYNSSGGTDGNPSTGSNPTFTFTAENFDILFGAFQGGGGDAIQRQKVNFGNPAFTISSGNADANGYGNFEYAVPSGFYSLCTKNLAEFG